MVTSWQAVRSVATMRPIAETRASWLNLLNFMLFLRHGPFGSKALKKTRLRCPVFIVKAASGVLPPAPKREPDDCTFSMDATSGAVVWNRRHSHRLGAGGIRRGLGVEQRSRCLAQLEVGDVIVEKIDSEEKLVGRGIDADGDRLQAGGVA